MALISPAIRQQVITDAQYCCEYCQTQQRLIGMPLVIDYLVAARSIWISENWHPPNI
jgi:hypothetical protein